MNGLEQITAWRKEGLTYHEIGLRTGYQQTSIKRWIDTQTIRYEHLKELEKRIARWFKIQELIGRGEL